MALPGETRRPRSARGEGEHLRTALLEAAESLLVEPRSAPPLSLREVARLAGVSPSAVYLHFASAQELIAAVVQLQSRRLVAAVLGLEAADGGAVPSVSLADIATGYVEWGLANPGAYQLLFESADRLGNPVGPSEPGWIVIDAAVAALRQAHGSSEADATTTAMRAWAALHGIVSLRIHKGDALWPTSARADALAVAASMG
ncbi:TetR/AcrR family transcriptional regulator [Agromyces aurantiacus]|uniref:TetR/AcrR family transcriptional regulator n=1 Tax=Agromyces aurantiacus TaxID=165814 RepID=A0ABV9R609_9MICO|nr:TetR/AcrR family transcriptional regulator [Agromyces aurantiacus]MBM7506099.1 AcrR family transcriptional regulator [Agromyces aurantiacus]